MFSFEQAEGKVRLISTWQSTYSGMIPDSFLQSLNVEQRTKNWIRKLENSTPRSLTIVAEVDGKIVDFIGVGPSREVEVANQGEVYASRTCEWYESLGWKSLEKNKIDRRANFELVEIQYVNEL
jgi:hypothetical protein